MIDIAALRRSEFPITQRYVYLNHAASGPLPRRTVSALTEQLTDFSERGVLAERRWMPVIERTRMLAAQLLNVTPAEIALVRNTSEGLGVIAAGFPWRTGDIIITAADEFPANVYPWRELAEQGVDTQIVPLHNGRIEPEAIAAAIDKTNGRARLISLSWVQFHNGFRCDVAALSDVCRDRGVIFGLDAIQGAGVLPLDLEATPVDFCAFGGQKWLLAPQGSGVLYMSNRLRSMLRPLHVGWLSVDWPDYSAFTYDRALKESAARFEEGTRSLLAIAGLEQSLGLLLEIGIEEVSSRIRALTDRLANGLLELGMDVRTPLEPIYRSGILSFAVPENRIQQTNSRGEISTAALFDALKARRVVAALREGAIRISPHIYTSEEEIDLLLDTIATQLEHRI